MSAVREHIEELAKSIDMEQYLDYEGIDYRVTRGARGTQLNLRECPVCGGDKWKVYINADTKLGNCFSGDCEAKFNLFSFARAHIGGNTRSTIEHLEVVAGSLGWQPKKQSAPVDPQSALQLPASIALPHEGQNLLYLEQRGIGADVATYFQLRFSLYGEHRYMLGNTVACQHYRERVIIPIFDLEGKLVSFQGRDITGRAEKKYLFPPGYASTGSYLYNGHNARGAKEIVVGEGVFDVMAQKVAMDADVSTRHVVPVGTFGKHLSVSDGRGSDQLGQFLRLKTEGLERVTFMWDGERAAMEAALKASMVLRQYGLEIRLARLPEGKDPNEVESGVVQAAYFQAQPINAASLIRLRLSLR